MIGIEVARAPATCATIVGGNGDRPARRTAPRRWRALAVALLALAAVAAGKAAQAQGSAAGAMVESAAAGLRDAEIAALRRALAAIPPRPADEPDVAMLQHRALGAGRGAAELAAQQALARERGLARVLVATAARAGRAARLAALDPARAQRFRGAVASLRPTWRAAAAEAGARLEVAAKLRAVETMTARQAARHAAARSAEVERRLELAMRLGRVELGRATAELLLARRLAAARARELDVIFAEALAGTPTAPLGSALAGDYAVATATPAPAITAPGDPAPAGWRLLAREPEDGLGHGTAPGLHRAMPIAGNVVRRFGEPGDGLLDHGVVILSRHVQPVRAPRSGVVSFAGPFKSYGLLLIVDHGDEYHSLLAGMSRLDVRRGNVVGAGEAVGVIAGSGSAPAGLYLELRHSGRPVNPLPWLAAREDKARG